MPGISPYRATLGGGGPTAGNETNITDRYDNVGVQAAKTGTGALHVAVAVLVVAIVLLAAGAFWLRNAKL